MGFIYSFSTEFHFKHACKNNSHATSLLITFNTCCPLSLKFQFYFKKESSKKNFLWASRLWVGRRKEPILGYVPKNNEKKNLVHKGLSYQ